MFYTYVYMMLPLPIGPELPLNPSSLYSVLPHDYDFGSFGMYARTHQIFHSVTFIKWSHKRKNPFTSLKWFDRTFCVHSTPKIGRNEDKQQVWWPQKQWICYMKTKPFIILCKETILGEFPISTFSLKLSQKHEGQYPLLKWLRKDYNGPGPVTVEKNRVKHSHAFPSLSTSSLKDY